MRSDQDRTVIAKGLNVSPGAAVGVVAFDADTAERWAKEEGRQVIMVRPETKPDDVHGMLAANGILTSRGGRTSHAALVARQFGKPAVVGVSELEIDLVARQMSIGEDLIVKEGDWISLDGTTGVVYLGKLATVVPDIRQPLSAQTAGLGRRNPRRWASGPTPITRATPSVPANMARPALACAAPSTCSLKPNVCRLCRR